jgi:7-cyano-7-deazaguanine synthase
MARALTLGLAHDLRIDAPYSGSSKAQVVARGIELGVPFELTLSCMNPRSEIHCGLCSKCRERHDAFIELGVADLTEYEDQRHVRA